MEMKTTANQGSKVIGNYTMLPNEPLGKGATGTVYKGNFGVIKAFRISPNSQ
jgi:hypothetical protein